MALWYRLSPVESRELKYRPVFSSLLSSGTRRYRMDCQPSYRSNAAEFEYKYSSQSSDTLSPPTNSTKNRGGSLGLRRPDREQPAADQDSGGHGARPLPRVVRQIPLSRPRARPLRRFPPSVGFLRAGMCQFWENT